MKRIAVALLFIGVNCFGQQYVHRTFDFRDSVNSQWFKTGTGNIGTILVDAYLTGKLKGYRYETGVEVLKTAPIPADIIPEPWSPKFDYFLDDRVTYNGKFYVAQADGPRGKTPLEAGEYWSEYEIYRDAVSDRHYFPEPQDTLAKNEFPAKFLMMSGQTFDPWSSWSDYYVTDVVFYNGVNYEALEDNRGKNPSEFPDLWVKTSAGSPIFYSQSELRGLRVLYYQETANGKPVYTPQIITPLVFNDNMGFLDDMDLHFYYTDAVNYLNSIRQPLLYKSNTGNVFNKIILNWDERGYLVDFLHAELKAGRIKPGKKDVINKAEFQRLLDDSEKPSASAKWIVFQDLKTPDIIISRIDIYKPRPVVRLPAKLLSNVPMEKAPEVFTTLEAIEKLNLNHWMDTTRIDSLAPLRNAVVIQPASKEYFFREKYHARVDSGHNVTLLAALKPAWEKIKKEFYARRLKTVSGYFEPYPWNYTYHEVKIEDWTFTDLKLGASEYQSPDSLTTLEDISGVNVTYTKRFDSGTAYSFVPEFVTILINNPDIGIEMGSTFEWTKLKELLGSSPDTKTIIPLIESGNLVFCNSELDYGLMEDK